MEILIAEDDHQLRKLLVRSLETLGHTILKAQDGRQAWDLFQAGSFQMVITDWLIPKMDGLELCRNIRAAAKGLYTYLIVITGKEQKKELLQILDCCSDDYIIKTFDSEELRARVKAGERIIKLEESHRNLDSTLNIVWNELKYKATVLKAYAADLPQVKCYPQQLNQVFMNILVNAAQAIEKQGEIRIATRKTDGFVEIVIGDTGQGVPEENLSRIFDPFFTTKEVGKGTGLGLNVAYNIIKKHQGALDVRSEVGIGTTFTILIPVNGPEASPDKDKS